jgi:hypothetical protein
MRKEQLRNLKQLSIKYAGGSSYEASWYFYDASIFGATATLRWAGIGIRLCVTP